MDSGTDKIKEVPHDHTFATPNGYGVGAHQGEIFIKFARPCTEVCLPPLHAIEIAIRLLQLAKRELAKPQEPT